MRINLRKQTEITLKLTVIDIDREKQQFLQSLQLKSKRRVPYER